MILQTQTTQTTQHTQQTRYERSPRLRADVALLTGRDGHLLRVGETHHHVHLARAEGDQLVEALATGATPEGAGARAALEALVDAGLVDPAPAHHTVVGEGLLAEALAAALVRMGSRVGPGGTPVVARDDDSDLPATGVACWISGDRVLLAPPAVPAVDVAARRRAATAHRDTEPLTRPVPGGRHVASSVLVPPAGLELAATTVAAELLRRDRPSHEAVTVDLHHLTVARRPVLPVPPEPR
ncbi:hypothetical protein NOK12_22800 [Nocardioides sp. OK12]|uniref:hypothetical protein n=1 Tax=Nocardioides sp. OK12 TaxID=2758661 RepID=UPI0021C2958A|nr:hypothetical protein [Nocardioides sp. OK12]GHJ59762.1 hypothetical protein NOK12_22800 [Nocardioides sp. OK12]